MSMKKSIGDRFSTVSPFGYEFTGTVRDVIAEDDDENGIHFYGAEFDGKGRRLSESELAERQDDNNIYLPSPAPSSEATNQKEGK